MTLDADARKRLEECVERACEAGLAAGLEPGMRWGRDAMEQFAFGKLQAVQALRRALLSELDRLQGGVGWVLVPLEPTEAMLMAGRAEGFMWPNSIYRAMLASLPEEPG